MKYRVSDGLKLRSPGCLGCQSRVVTTEIWPGWSILGTALSSHSHLPRLGQTRIDEDFLGLPHHRTGDWFEERTRPTLGLENNSCQCPAGWNDRSLGEEKSAEYKVGAERLDCSEDLIIFFTIPPSFSVCLLAGKFNLVWHLEIKKNPRSVFVLLKVSCRRQVNTNKNEFNFNSCFLKIFSSLVYFFNYSLVSLVF